MCKTWRVGGVTFFGQHFRKQVGCPIPRALGAGDSAKFSTISLASGFFHSQTESTPNNVNVVVVF